LKVSDRRMAYAIRRKMVEGVIFISYNVVAVIDLNIVSCLLN